MAKVLVIRKTDKTIHKVPLVNKAALMAYSNRLPVGKQWTFETMEEAEANKLPFIDESYVTAGDAQLKVKDLEGVVSEKDSQIAELQKQLAALNKPTETAVEIIAKINAAISPEEVNAIVGTDERKTVTDAASKKIASF